MKRKKILARSVLVALLLQIISYAALSQSNGTVSLTASPTCSGDTMYVPVTFTGWDQPDVAAIDLVVLIADTSIVAYRGNNNIHPSFTAPIVNCVGAGGSSKKLYYSWAYITPGTVNSGTLIVFKFLCKSGGSTGLSFVTSASAVTDISGNYYNISWTGATATVNTIPSQPGTISGTTTPLFGSTQVYSIAAVAGATSYTWSVPSGGSPTWTINSGQGSTSLNTTTGIVSGKIIVRASNSCGLGPQRALSVTKTAPAIVNICSVTACAGTIAEVPVTLSGLDLPNAAAMDLVVRIPDTTVIGYRGFTDLNPAFSGSFSNCVNSGGTSKTIYFSWSNTSPVVISSDTLLKFLFETKRKGIQNLNISALDAVITDLENNPYTTTWNPGSLTVDSIPVKAGIISGSANPLFGSTQTYSIAPIPNATAYTWTLPSGGSPAWSINSGQGSFAINSTVGIKSGLIRVAVTNACGTGEQRTLTVSKYAAASLSIPSATTCMGDTLFAPVIFTGLAQPNTGALEFELLISDTSIIGYRGIKSTHVSFDNPVINYIPAGGSSCKLIYSWSDANVASVPSDTLIIFKLLPKQNGTANLSFVNGTGIAIDLESNYYTTSWNSGIATISSPPSQPSAISGNPMPITGISETYSITAVPGATSYTWSVPSGGTPAWIITSGQGSTSITVTPGSSIGDISVLASNACGSSSPAVFSVTYPANSCTVSLGNYNGCAGDTAFIPVMFTGWDQPDVAAISLAINISDTTIIGYRGYSSEHPAFSSPTINCVDPGVGTTRQIWYGWSSTTPGSVASDTLVILKFLIKSNGTSALTFLTDIAEEITDGATPRPKPYNVTWIGSTINSSVGITVQPVNDTIFSGGFATYTVVTTSFPGIYYQWQVSDNGGLSWQNAAGAVYTGTTSATLSLPGATAGMNGYQYRCMVNTSCSSQFSATVVYKLFSLSGTIRYQAPLPYSLYDATKKTKVLLFNSGSSIACDSAELTSSGYVLNNLKPGYYNLGVKTLRSPGGINATDGIMIDRALTGIVSFKRLQRLAGETRVNGVMTAADGLNCKKYYTHLITTFPMKDWVFAAYMPGVDSTKICNSSTMGSIIVNNGYNKRITSTDVTLNIGALCIGDVNGSRTSSKIKSAIIPEISGEIMAEQYATIDLPLYLNEDAEAGAISLDLDYAADKVAIEEVRLNNPRLSENDFLYTISNGNLVLAWSSDEPWAIRHDEAFASIRLKVLANISGDEPIKAITHINDIEFADLSADVLPGISVTMPVIKRNANTIIHGLFVGDCRPNPVTDVSRISFIIPENSHVTIQLLNPLGECCAVLRSGNYDSGYYETEINSKSLAAGLYTCRMTFTTDKGIEVFNKMIVVAQ